MSLVGPKLRSRNVCFSPLSGDKPTSRDRVQNDAIAPEQMLAVHVASTRM